MGFDPIAEDPPVDPTFPAALVAVGFRSGGEPLNGVAYVPVGPGPHPAALVLHGIPGYERNLDLAQAYRRAGWVAMVFHYRGAWGSGGTFSFRHVLDDAAAAVDQMRSHETRDACRIDPERIALVGHSMGGWASLMTAPDTNVLGAASIAGFNVGAAAAPLKDHPEVIESLAQIFQPQMGPLGGIDVRRLFEEAGAAVERLDARSRAAALASLPVLLVGGDERPGGADGRAPPAVGQGHARRRCLVPDRASVRNRSPVLGPSSRAGEDNPRLAQSALECVDILMLD